jgi:transcriptional regulator with XRE-family HTH domain
MLPYGDRWSAIVDRCLAMGVARLLDMPLERVEITRKLRQLIRLMRTDQAHLTQRGAALAAGLSEIWWRQIESGHTDYATADTIARMCYAVGVTPDQLREIGQGHVAELVELRLGVLGSDRPADMEAHLMQTPGLTDQQRMALVTMAQAIRNAR